MNKTVLAVDDDKDIVLDEIIKTDKFLIVPSFTIPNRPLKHCYYIPHIKSISIKNTAIPTTPVYVKFTSLQQKNYRIVIADYEEFL